MLSMWLAWILIIFVVFVFVVNLNHMVAWFGD